MSETIETPPVEAAAPPVETPPVVTPPADDDAALEQDLAGDIIEVPDSGAENGKVKLVPLSAATGARKEAATLRKELAEAKEGSAKAQQLEARLAQLEGQINTLAPKAQAYDAAVAAQQAQPAKPAEMTADERAELEEIARDLDLYNADGSPNIERAKRIQAREVRVAQTAAKQAIAPYAHHTVSQQANHMLARAKQTLKDKGIEIPDAAVESAWSRLSPEQSAHPDGAKWLLAALVGAHILTQPKSPAHRGADGKFTAQPSADLATPLHTEKAGGKDPGSTIALSDAEKKFLKDTGMTEKEYHESSQNAPWLRR